MSAARSGAASPWFGEGTLAVAFVVLAVVALFAVPQVVGRRAATIQREIAEHLDPASLEAAQLSIVQNQEMVLFLYYVVTGEATYKIQYDRAIDKETALYDSLNAHVEDLQPQGVREQLANLSSAVENWHLEQRTAFDSTAARLAALAQLDSEQTHYARIQQRTLALYNAIQDQADQAQAGTQWLQALQRWVTFALVLLALAATVAVVRVGSKLHVATSEAEDRRQDAVRSRREIDALLEATGDGVVAMDLEGRCLSVNRAGCELLDYVEGGLRGRDVHDVLHHTTLDGSPRLREDSRLLAALTRGRSARSGDVDVLWRRDGSPLPVQWSLRPLIDGSLLKGGVLTFTDMTEIREKEQALRRAVRVREEVVSIVSHDLRNPLGVVRAAAELLLELPLNEAERRKQADIVKRSAARMSHLIGDLLDVSRIEAGALVVRPAQEDPAELLEETRALFAAQVERRGVTLCVEVGTGLPSVIVDHDRIVQALSNLVENAIKATPEGGRITLACGRSADGEVTLSVEDTGPGIPAEAMDHLFDRFWQASRGDRTGSGLGLAIVRGIAVAHGGTVRVDSRPGHGAAFHILIPIDGVGVRGVRA